MNELSERRDATGKPVNALMNDEANAPIGIVALWRLLKSNKLMVFTPMFVLGLLAGLVTLRSADTFSAEAQFILTRDNIDIIELESTDRETVDLAVVTYAVNLLNSRAVALEVIDQLDLLNDPIVNPFIGLETIEQQPGMVRRLLYSTGLQNPPDLSDVSIEDTQRDYVLSWLQSVYVATALPNSNVVFVTAQTHDANLSANVANGLIDAYLNFSLRKSQEEADAAIGALSNRVQSLRLQMENDQAALQDAQANLQIPSAEALQALTLEIFDLRTREDDLSARTDTLQRARASLDDLAGQSGAAIAAAFAENPEIARIAGSIQPTPDTAANDLARLQQITARDLRTQERQLAAITDSRTRLEGRLRNGSANLSEVSRLEVELETTRAVYSSALARLKELVLESGIRNKGGRFLAPAVPPVGADRQFRRRIVAIAMILGGLIGATMVLVREAANERVRHISDVSTGTGRIATVEIPAIKSRFMSRDTRRAQQFLLGGNTPFSEAIRNCRRLVFEQYVSSMPPVICVMSALPNEGKSTLCGALARSFVLIGERVLVIDADMRAAGLSQSVLGSVPAKGLQNAIEAGPGAAKAFIKKNASLGFDFLPAGSDGKNPSDLIETVNFGELIKSLYDDYDVIIIDTPPALLFPDARPVAALSSNVVTVAAYNQTPKSALREVLDLLPHALRSQMTVALCKTPRTTGARFGVSEKALNY
ncbi:MAG: AAA family ATPase [Pseudomonadota bacterium]